MSGMRSAAAGVLLLTAATAKAQVPAAVVTPWSGASGARSDAALRVAMLDLHNAARLERRAVPLVWSAVLAREAAVHARTLARRDVFEHSVRGGRHPQGENLFTGTRGAFSHAEMGAQWVAQRAAFRPGRFPQVSRTRDWRDVGHYTQVVWPATRALGCALASNARSDFLVCRYAPGGNLVGEAMP